MQCLICWVGTFLTSVVTIAFCRRCGKTKIRGKITGGSGFVGLVLGCVGLASGFVGLCRVLSGWCRVLSGFVGFCRVEAFVLGFRG